MPVRLEPHLEPLGSAHDAQVGGHLVEQVRRRTGAELDGTSLTGWYWAAVVAAALVVASAALAARYVGSWPEMGTKYDAPAAQAERASDGPTDNIDIWKAIDEGRDPTA